VGTIQGGTANNVVAEAVCVKAEARSLNEDKLIEQVRHMHEQFEASAAEIGAHVQFTGGRVYPGYRHEPDSAVMRLAAEGLRRAGHEPTYHPTGGGSDANIFNARGITTVVLSCGYEDAHSVTEHVAFADIWLNALWCLGLVEAAASHL